MAPVRSVREAPLRIRILQGMGMGALLMALRIPAIAGSRSMPTLGRALELVVVVAVGGGVGGAVYYFTDSLRAQAGWRKTLANVLSLLAYCAAAFLIAIFVLGPP